MNDDDICTRPSVALRERYGRVNSLFQGGSRFDLYRWMCTAHRIIPCAIMLLERSTVPFGMKWSSFTRKFHRNQGGDPLSTDPSTARIAGSR